MIITATGIMTTIFIDEIFEAIGDDNIGGVIAFGVWTGVWILLSFLLIIPLCLSQKRRGSNLKRVIEDWNRRVSSNSDVWFEIRIEKSFLQNISASSSGYHRRPERKDEKDVYILA